MPNSLRDRERRNRVAFLLVVAAASVMLWQTVPGRFLLYPFTVLATWFHEMGHGVASIVTGRGLERLLIFADGSGLAQSPRPLDGYRLVDAMIAASGPLGPAVVGALLLGASRSSAATQRSLAVLGVLLIASTVIWVRSLFGWLILPGVGIAMLVLALRAPESWQRFAIQLIGIQACISAWNQFDYLFNERATVSGELLKSDTGAIADALLLPYWFWGGVISVTIVALLWLSLRIGIRR